MRLEGGDRETTEETTEGMEKMEKEYDRLLLKLKRNAL